MQNRRFSWVGFGIFAGISAFGCGDASERGEAEGGEAVAATSLEASSEFDRELIAAKHAHAEPALREAAMVAVMDKYGVEHAPLRDVQQAMPALEASEELADTLPGLPGAPELKPTAASAFNPVRRDFTAGNDIHTYRSFVSVGNGQYTRLAALGSTASVDPFLVAYYIDDNGAASSAYKVKVIGYNDDVSSSNRNAVVEWTNTTGSSKNVLFVAFAYSSATRGKGVISTTVGSSSVNLMDREIGGLHQFGATQLPAVPSNCLPSTTRVKETPVFGGGFRGAALAIDTQAMRGVYIEDSPGIGPITVEVSGGSMHNPYPSFALLFETYTGILPSNWSETPSQYRYTQTDHYVCVQ